MGNLYSQFNYDAATVIRPLTAAITATETNATILDLGDGLVDGYVVVDVSAIDTVTGDEGYALYVEGSPDAAFGTAGNIRVIADLKLGGATATAPNGAADVPGRYVIPFRNERGGTTTRYVRLYTLITGTSPSITFLAFVAADQ